MFSSPHSTLTKEKKNQDKESLVWHLSWFVTAYVKFREKNAEFTGFDKTVIYFPVRYNESQMKQSVTNIH